MRIKPLYKFDDDHQQEIIRMEALKNTGWGLLGIAFLVAIVFVNALLIGGTAWASSHVLDLVPFNNIVTVVCIVLLLPLAPFRKTRIVSAYGLYVASFVFGVCVWMYGFVVTYEIWGGGGVLIGLMLGIVGIVPLGIIAASWHSEWVIVAELVYGLILTYGARALALWLAMKIEPHEMGKPGYPAASSLRAWFVSSKSAEKIRYQQIILTALGVLSLGGLAVRGIFDPARYDHQQAMMNFHYHPMASIFGALLPAVILSPLAYWMFGWILRRIAARSKVCEHCAETIKSDARVCRYCGQEVAPAKVALQQSRQPSRRTMMTACVFGLVFIGSAGVWLADTQRTQVPPNIPPFDELPSPSMTAGPFEDATAAYSRGDYATALRLFRPLADEGNSAAQNKLGSMYSNGEGVPQDDAQAVRWLRRAADQGNTSAQNNLGIAYWNGRGVRRNDAEAVRWFRLAAEQGFVDAQSNLGHMYFAGRAEMQNDTEAAKWFRLAADQGNASAQYFLGTMYADGRGVPKNYVNAYTWLNLAAAQGDTVVGDVAAKFRDLVEQSMTPVQLSESKKFAREWKPNRNDNLQHWSIR